MLKPPGANRHSPPNGEPTKEAETIELNLSMGHTIHILKYDPNAEEKKIIVNQLSRQRKDKVFQYSYLVYSPTRKVRPDAAVLQGCTARLTNHLALCEEICEKFSTVPRVFE